MINKPPHRSGFTLIELLVVITIILLISAIALPTVLPALSHRQVSEGARILQGTLVGARDSAIHNGAPSGIRLLPDPAFPINYLANGTIDPTYPLAANRIIPLESAPEYSEGKVSSFQAFPGFVPPYPCLVVVETVAYLSPPPNSVALPNAPTSWFWNIRVGDKIQINNAGPWYTVVGPMVLTPASGGNTEMFVNVGTPGAAAAAPWGTLTQVQAGQQVVPEYLFLVNGQDDNGNGWIDEGFDGVDNNGNGIIDDPGSQDVHSPIFNQFSEWEPEAWQGAIGATLQFNNQLYTIQRRPTPASNSREVSLPTNVVIDMTTWGYPFPTAALPALTPSLERSRLPVNIYTGFVDILVYPSGTVVPTTIYSTPASFGMSASFFHFWVAERIDVVALPPNPPGVPPPYLPIGNVSRQLQSTPPYGGPQIQGEYRLVTMFTRTGQITTADGVQFDNPVLAQQQNRLYNPSYPFLAAQQGIRGGR